MHNAINAINTPHSTTTTFKRPRKKSPHGAADALASTGTGSFRSSAGVDVGTGVKRGQNVTDVSSVMVRTWLSNHPHCVTDLVV